MVSVLILWLHNLHWFATSARRGFYILSMPLNFTILFHAYGMTQLLFMNMYDFNKHFFFLCCQLASEAVNFLEFH